MTFVSDSATGADRRRSTRAKTTNRRRRVVATIGGARVVPMVAGAAIGLGSPSAGAATGYGPYSVIGTGSNGLNEHSAPSASAALKGNLPNGSTVYIACQVAGASYATGGSPASESIWDQLTSGLYVADYWVSTPATGTFSSGIPQCPTGGGSNPGSLGSQLSNGQGMSPGQYLQSPSGQYRLVMQGDGNLVEYNASNAPLWDPPPPTGTYGYPGAYAVMQGDGNFVVYSAGGSALWASYTNRPGDHLALQDDGNLVIYAGSSPLWATMSGSVLPRGRTTTGNYYPGGQCTRYAEQEAANYLGVFPQIGGDAHYWSGNAAANGWAVGSGPRIGSVIVFQAWTDGAGSVGHVAWVTNYYPSTGTVVFNEMNFKGLGVVDTRSITNGVNNPNISYIYMNP
jgi:surface antigen